MTVLALRVVLVGLAAYRLARALSVDSITEPFRAWVFWAGHDDPDGSDEPPVTSRPLAWLYGLVSCGYCASWWIALVLFLVWTGLGWVNLLAAVAAAGAAALFVGIDQAVAGD